GVGVAARAIVLWNDQINQYRDRGVFVRGEERRLVGLRLFRRRRARLLRVRVRLLGLGRRPGHGRGDRGGANQLERRSTRDLGHERSSPAFSDALRLCSISDREDTNHEEEWIREITHSDNWLRSSAMYSAVRIDSARSVHVTFLSAFETNGPPSAMNRFLTSCAWQN